MTDINLNLITCDPLKAIISQSTCRANHHTALNAYQQVKAGKAIGDLDEYTIDRLITCGQCPELGAMIDVNFLMDKAREEIKQYITIIEAVMDSEPQEDGEANRQANTRYRRKLSHAEEREEEALRILQENAHEWVVPGACELPSAIFDNLLKQFQDTIVKQSEITHKQCTRYVYMWIGAVIEEKAEDEEEDEYPY